MLRPPFGLAFGSPDRRHPSVLSLHVYQGKSEKGGRKKGHRSGN